MSKLLSQFYKWRLKTPKERVAKFQEKTNELLGRYNAKIVAEIKLIADEDEKLITDRFNKLKEDFNVEIQAMVQIVPKLYPDEIKKLEEEKKKQEAMEKTSTSTEEVKKDDDKV